MTIIVSTESFVLNVKYINKLEMDHAKNIGFPPPPTIKTFAQSQTKLS